MKEEKICMQKNSLRKSSPLTFMDISLHRTLLYGLAALWVFFLHLPFKTPKVGGWTLVYYIQFYGACGVEMFTLLTGYGLYLSLRKHGLRKFYINRALRVWLPASLISLVVCIFKGCTVWTAAGVLAVFPYWFGMPAPWFAGFILLMYVIYPLFHWMLEHHKKTYFLLCALAWPVVFVLCGLFENVILPIGQGFARIPVFMLGVALTPAFVENKKIPLWIIPAGFACFFAIMLLKSAVYFPTGISYCLRTVAYTSLSFSLISLFAYIARFLLKCGLGRAFYKICAFFGGISLEFYIIFIYVRNAMLEMPVYSTVTDNLLKISLVGGITSIVLSVLTRWLCGVLIQEFNKTKIPE